LIIACYFECYLSTFFKYFYLANLEKCFVWCSIKIDSASAHILDLITRSHKTNFTAPKTPSVKKQNLNNGVVKKKDIKIIFHLIPKLSCMDIFDHVLRVNFYYPNLEKWVKFMEINSITEDDYSLFNCFLFLSELNLGIELYW